MTLDELLETVPVEVKNAIEEICEKAGTYDANWEVLKAAGELLVKYKVDNALLNKLITVIRRFIDDTDLPVTELVDAQIAEIEDLIHAF